MTSRTSAETRAETRHDPTDVLIIGAGASGATAAKVLTEHGRLTVREALRKKDTPYEKLGLGDPTRSDDELLEALGLAVDQGAEAGDQPFLRIGGRRREAEEGRASIFTAARSTTTLPLKPTGPAKPTAAPVAFWTSASAAMKTSSTPRARARRISFTS